MFKKKLIKLRKPRGLKQKWAKRTRLRPARERARDSYVPAAPEMTWFLFSHKEGNESVSLFWSTETNKETVFNWSDKSRRKMVAFFFIPFLLLLASALHLFQEYKISGVTGGFSPFCWRCWHISISATVRPQMSYPKKSLLYCQKKKINKLKEKEVKPHTNWMAASWLMNPK